MKRSRTVYMLSSLLVLTACLNRETEQDSSSENDEYELVWADEFDYEGLPDSSRWIYDTEGNEARWGNAEEQWYTENDIENARVADGILKITAIREDYLDRKFTSARLVSNAAWQYVKVEVRAKVPPGRGTWSAIWMMPGGWTFHDGNWPDIGEFDIMEHVGYDPGVIHASAHSRDYQWQKGTQKTNTIKINDASDRFHSYILEWDADKVSAYVDDSLYFSYKNEGLGESKWPYDKPFYLILNVAVGGAWGSVQGIDESAFPQTMDIDYVRIYRKK